ncbi:MAG: hypothetical protein ACOC2N_01660 [Spirochaetota bacterium]
MEATEMRLEKGMILETPNGEMEVLALLGANQVGSITGVTVNTGVTQIKLRNEQGEEMDIPVAAIEQGFEKGFVTIKE